MILECTVTMELELCHKNTGKCITLSEEIKQCVDERSEEYHVLCEEIKDKLKDIKNDEERAKVVLLYLSEQSKNVCQVSFDNVVSTVKDCYLKNAKGVIWFGGAVINPLDFCMVRVKDFDVKVRRKEK